MEIIVALLINYLYLVMEINVQQVKIQKLYENKSMDCHK